MKKNLLILITFLSALHTSYGQRIDEVIGNYTGRNAEGYFRPLASSLTSSFNTGQVFKSSIDSGFHIYVGIVATQTFILGDDLKFFTGQTPPDFSPAQEARVSTVLGPPEPVTVQGQKGTSFTFPAGMGIGSFILGVPQITVGNVAGTEITARFFTIKVNDDFGKIQVFGGGIRHDIGRYFLKKSGINLSVEGFYQQLQVGKYSDLQTLKAGIYAGQQLGRFHYYAFAGYQQGKLSVSYENAELEEQVNIKTNNGNPLLLAVGTGIKLGIIRLHAQVSFISPVVVAAGLGINF